MADDHDPSNDVNENDDGGEFDYDEPTTIAPVAPPAAQPVQTAATSLLDEDYEDDEPIEDYVVNLVVNEKPDGLPSGFGDAVTDRYGNTIYDSLNAASTAVYDELNGNGTGITGGKRWFGWSTTKLLLVGLIALCILGIILAAIFFLVSKKFKKNPRTTGTSGSTTTTKAAVTKGVSPDPKYQPVPNV